MVFQRNGFDLILSVFCMFATSPKEEMAPVKE